MNIYNIGNKMSDITFIPVKHKHDIRKIIPKHQMAFLLVKPEIKY